jgi:HEPN domain-containing protein
MGAQTELLLRKSAANEQAIASADLEKVPDVFGFQTQQAVEKLLKAILCELGIGYRRTHDLAGMVESHDQPLPKPLIAIERLTAFAVEFRYDDLPSALVLDPAEARATVALLRQHIAGRIAQIAAARQNLNSP